MATSKEKVESSLNQLMEIKKNCFVELDHIVENCRWLTTLVLAEIGGIATYRKLMEKTNLSLFSLNILLLGMTILFFMVSVITSRWSKKKISDLIQKYLPKIQEIDHNNNISPNDGDKEVMDIILYVDKEVLIIPQYTKIFESLGVVGFILSSILAMIGLFYFEIIYLFN
ncbi:MAG: hypothetical protein BGO86_04570 [Chryseobacterium sp. 36-9]|nr:MAG: hypothetical protein BGO86_04570 [Chryseobacterium sp. 36-9]